MEVVKNTGVLKQCGPCRRCAVGSAPVAKQFWARRRGVCVEKKSETVDACVDVSETGAGAKSK
jgi:hypothetical protein